MLEVMKSARSPSCAGNAALKPQRGFTLVELLVVLALIALIVGIAVPNLRRAMVRADLMEEVKMVRQALAVARINAIKNSRRVAVLLLPEETGEHFDRQVVAWVDETSDEMPDAGDEVVGRWNLGPKVAVGPEPSDANLTLHEMASQTRGVIFLPNGSAIVHEDEVGVGTGGLVISDNNSNRILLLIRASGTVEERMWDGTSWDTRLIHWRY